MPVRAFACLALFVVACTMPNPQWVADAGVVAVTDASVPGAADLAGPIGVDQGVATDMAMAVPPDLSQPHEEWPDFSTPKCKDRKSEISCEATFDCYWTGSRCKSESDPVPSCGAYSTKSDCLLEDGCEWRDFGDFGSCFVAQ